jgi:hypothetical protein
VRVVSSPDNAGTGQHYRMVRVRQARREGVREKPVFNAPQVSRQLEPGGSGLDSGAHPLTFCWGGELRGRIEVVDSGGHGDCLRRSRGDAAGV